VIRKLAETPNRSRVHAARAAEELGCDLSQVYRLLTRFQVDPRLTSLVPQRRGRRQGQLMLSAAVDEVVYQAAQSETGNSLSEPAKLSRQPGPPLASDLKRSK